MAIVKSIQSEADYDAALQRVTELIDDLSGSDGQVEDANHPSRIELDALVALIETFEGVHYPIGQTKSAAVAES